MPKPKFDPTQPYEPAAAEKPAFNPSAPFQPADSGASPMEHVLRDASEAAKSYSGGLLSPSIERMQAASAANDDVGRAAIANPMAVSDMEAAETPEMKVAAAQEQNKQEAFENANPTESTIAKYAPMVAPGGPLSELLGVGKKLATGAAKATGLSSIPDYLMQKAVGIRKYSPGVGSKLVDEGLIGTKSALKSQVASKLPEVEEQLQGAVAATPGAIDSSKVAEQVADRASKYVTSTGKSTAQTQPILDAIAARASDIESRGAVSPKEALEYKRMTGNEGWNPRGTPVERLQGQLARTENQAYGGEIDKAYRAAHPENPDAFKAANDRYSALVPANKALNTPVTNRKSPFSLSDLVFSSTGAALGGGGGGAAGYALSRALQEPLVQSALAQGTQKGGRALANLAGAPLSRFGGRSIMEQIQSDDDLKKQIK